MQPAQLPLDLYRGDSQRLQVKLWIDANATIPYDLTGVSAKAEIRERPGGAKITGMACTITLPNAIEVFLAAPDSHKLPSKGVWDLQLTWLAGDVKTPLAGPVTVTQDVTDSTP